MRLSVQSCFLHITGVCEFVFMFFSAVSVSEFSLYITGGIFHFGAKQVLAADVDLAKAEDIKTAIKLLAQVSSFSLCWCA